jgi:NTP pyrophosphatase (non-canonical NTP hydrolase)
MSDTTTTIAQLKQRMATFVTERAWDKNHNPKNLSMSIAIEAAELMEKFQFCDSDESYEIAEQDKQEIGRELADVLAYVISFANACNIEVSHVFEEKMKRNEQRYPVEAITGTFENYRAVKRARKIDE